MSDKRKTEQFQPGRGYGKADWDAVSDSPEATDEDLAQAKPFTEAFPELAEKMCGLRGPQKAKGKKEEGGGGGAGEHGTVGAITRIENCPPIS